MIKITKCKNLDIQRVENETIIYSLDKDIIVCLNETATILWELLDEYSYFDDIANRYYLFFDDKPTIDEVRNDVDNILSDYVRAGLILIAEEK